MFSNARNVVFTGNPTFTGHIHTSNSSPTRAVDDGMRVLAQRMAKGAMHDSGERFDAPTCHPETRIAIQDAILGWANNTTRYEPVTWLYGPAGAGKSAIAQTISQKLHLMGLLTASFFFSRTRNNLERGNERRLIPTLAYQLSQSIPATRSHICAVVQNNPVVFDLSLESQVQTLILDPLTAVYNESSDLPGRMLIVVNGLDECRKDDSNAQGRVVNALIRAVTSIPHQSHKVLITSRPEHHIAAIFKAFKPGLVRDFELNNTWQPDDDIRVFLNAEFSEIKRLHPYFDSHNAEQTWPSRADIDALVERSSGHLRFRGHQIHQNNDDRPYAELDALYEHIFSQIRGVEKVLTVLSLERTVHSEGKFRAPLGLLLSEFIGASINEIKFWLRPLVSVLVWENDTVRYMHASLPDFLLDPTRSNAFCVYSPSISTGIVRHALLLLDDDSTITRDHLMPVLLRIPRYYSRQSQPQNRIQINSLLSDFNIVESVICRMDADLFDYETTRALASYMEWILTEWESGDPFECRKVLDEPLSQIQAWLIEHLAYDGFNGSQNCDQIDLWPFFIFPKVRVSCCAEDLQRQISTEIATALEICGPTTFTYHLLRDEDIELSDETMLLYCLLPHISQWLSRTSLLGRYAITKERYAVALLRTSRYLLRLPNAELAEVLNDGAPGYITLSSTMLAARIAFSTFMGLAPRNTELYFFVLFMHSIIVDYQQSSDEKASGSQQKATNIVRRMATSARHYLQMTRQIFPFLYDPASSKYLQTQTHAKAVWTRVKSNFYDPIMSVQLEPLADLDLEMKQWRSYHAHWHIRS